MNQLYHDDNLVTLRQHISDKSVDLIHSDRLFNISRHCGVSFKDERRCELVAQVVKDIGHWD
ncbi:MAG: hypothetical protein NZ571_06265 [Anaerolineae bacterium]|nr:hypothetical protein [Anaerolineae bacterium]